MLTFAVDDDNFSLFRWPDGLSRPRLLYQYILQRQCALFGISRPNGDPTAQTATVHNGLFLRSHAIPRGRQLRTELRHSIQLQPEVRKRCRWTNVGVGFPLVHSYQRLNLCVSSTFDELHKPFRRTVDCFNFVCSTSMFCVKITI